MGYSRFLAQYPYLVITAVSIVALTCLVVMIAMGELPKFPDPQLGFEPRGTVMSGRIQTHEKLLDQTLSDKAHSAEIYHYKNRHQSTESTLRDGSATDEEAKRWLRDEDEDEEEDLAEDGDAYNITEPFFCGPPHQGYARLVFTSIDGSSLFEHQHIQSMCHLEEFYIRRQTVFPDICIRTTHTSVPCRTWSLGNYIALLSNKSSCMDITPSDVNHVEELLMSCVTYYKRRILMPTCYEATEEDMHINNCHEIPAKCKKYNAVYEILHFITDIDFLKERKINEINSLDTKLTYSMSLLPIAAGIVMEEVYEGIESHTLADEFTQVVAINFDIKANLFNQYLHRDLMWFSIALISIFLLMWLYTLSLFITFMTIASILISLELAYFVYTMVFEIEFFPFMNLLTAVILIGVGCDDAFIYCKVWNLAKLEKNIGTLEKVISDTLRHASLSMFVTSLTTASAFYANYVSHITALQCFAIYAGTAVLFNFVLMITWIPAVIVIYEKWCTACLTCYSPDVYTAKRGFCFYSCKLPYKVYHLIADWSRIFFEKLLPCLVIKLRYFWVTISGVLAIMAMVCVFFKPKLKLPSSNEFQVFSLSHPFEVYDFMIKDKFWFEKAAGINSPTMPLTVVWGVNPVDNGNHLDPYSEGTLEFDETFNVAKPDSQEWLLKFCQNLRATDFYQVSFGPQLTNCFIEHFKRFMERSCEDVNGEDLTPCCHASKFPYSEAVFHKCFRIYRPLLAHTRELYFSGHLAGPRYSKDTGEMVALIVEFDSNEIFSFNYQSMQHFYKGFNGWVDEQLLTAPQGMRRGWFVSHFEFYDLQDTLAQGTPVAIAISIGVASIVAFLTTLNVLITIHAMLSIAAAIFSTIAVLVLLGWELNILESVTITVAVGLSMDFALHYGMAYRLAPDYDREMRVVCATSRMGSPVTMAALTTFLAGLLMLPSTVLAYHQLGLFLVTIMPLSWWFATFFFQSLLKLLGPEGGFGQFNWPSCDCCIGSEREHIDKTVYTMSESTLSSSSTHNANGSETHELEPLTEREYHTYHRHRPMKLAHRHSNGSAVDSTMCDTVVRVRSNNSQKASVSLSPQHEVVPPSSERLIQIDGAESPPSVPTNGVLKQNGNGDIWMRAPQDACIV